MKLGTLLLRDGVITLDQLEGALRAQVLYGGKLGTNLVELGYISLDTLTIYLGKTLGVPPATKARFEAADPDALQRLPAALAQKHLVFPLAVAKESGSLVVAMATPRDDDVIAALAQATKLKISPCVAPELRLMHYLEKSYRIDRTTLKRPRRTPTTPPPMRAMSIDPWRPASHGPPSVSLVECLTQLESALTRDEIGDGILAFARGRLEAAVLFLAKDGTARGWKGFAPALDAAGIEALALPVRASPCLSGAFDGRTLWRGPLRAADPLLAGLRVVRPPDEALALPVLIGGHVANLFYGHAPPSAVVPEGVIDALASVTEAAGEAYARLVEAARERA